MSCPTVTTPLGEAKGRVLAKAKCDEAKQVFAYLSLPFAKPPVGELRFEPPQKAKPWEGVLDATSAPPGPMQSFHFTYPMLAYMPVPLVGVDDPSKMSEDCLYVNVYTTNPNKTAKMPVLFWIYGGAFNVGSAVQYNGQAICGLNDVVLVVPQYRVNVFGFFTTGKDTKWPGNMGLLDQVMALEWTRDNISAFGGDPNNVTIFGESAGSISVSLHVTSPMSRGLFHRAISHSGVGNMSGIMKSKSNPKPIFVQTAMMKADQSGIRKLILDDLKITATEPKEVVKQLKAVDAKKIVEVLGKEGEKKMMVPTIDRKFNPKHPLELLNDGKYNPVPYIIGMNNTEGAGILSFRFGEEFVEGFDETTAKAIINGIMSDFVPPSKLETVNKAVVDFYLGILDDDKYKWSKMVASINADSSFTVSSIAQALAHSGAGLDTYMYYMTHQPRFHHDDAFSGNVKHKPEFCEADHADDIMFTFGHPITNGKFTLEMKYSDDEVALGKRWMKTICQFAKTGNPNCDGEKEWPKYDAKTKQHLVLKWPYDVGSNLLEKHYKFWSETIPALINKPCVSKF